MKFKEFYKAKYDEKTEIFESVFEKYYAKGCFGSIKKDTIKEQQFNWFNKFQMLLEEKEIPSILTVLANRDNVCSREWFSKIYKTDILEKSREEIKTIVTNILGDSK
jgi:predicted AAA+ superfamily ATPase